MAQGSLQKGLRQGALALAVTAGCLAVGLVLYCMMRRVPFPYELHWMEGALLDHASRAAAGQALFGPPSADFIPLLYTPLSYYAIAWLPGQVDFLSARILSLLCLAASMAIGVRLVRRAAPGSIFSLWALPLFLAGYFAVDASYDVVRADHLLALLCVAALGALSLRDGRVAVAAFVVFSVAAFFTKQSALLYLLPLLAAALWVRRRVAVAAGSLAALGIGILYVVTDLRTDGWFHTFVREVPASIGFSTAALVESLRADFLGALLVPTLASLVALALALREPRRDCGERQRRVLLAGAACGALLFSVVSRFSVGGAKNVLGLHVLFGSLALPLVLDRLIEGTPTARRKLAATLAYLTLCLALVLPLERPNAFVPDSQDLQRWQDFDAALDEFGGATEIWIVAHGHLGRGGDSRGPHLAAMMNYLGVGGTGASSAERALPPELLTRIAQREFDAIVVLDWDRLTQSLIAPHYEPDPSGRTFDLPQHTGWRPGTERFWLPRP